MKLTFIMNILLVNQIRYMKVVPIQVNNMEPSLKFSELNRLCLIELMLICQIIPFYVYFCKNERCSMDLRTMCASTNRL